MEVKDQLNEIETVLFEQVSVWDGLHLNKNKGL